MRPSQKSGRSRGKNNRNNNKNAGHSPNRVYESAGPEGKVRGTPQQIIDKYLQLARDFQLSGDRVTAENFLQHAEHYSRLLIAAQESQAERQAQHNQQNQQPQGGQNAGQNGGQQNNQNNNQTGGGRQDNRSDGRSDGRDDREDGREDGRDGGRDGGRDASAESDDAERGASGGDPRRQDDKPRRARDDGGNFMQRLNDDQPDDQPDSGGLGAIDAAQGAPDLFDTPESKAKPRARRPRPKSPRANADAPAAEPKPDEPKTPSEAAE